MLVSMFRISKSLIITSRYLQCQAELLDKDSLIKFYTDNKWCNCSMRKELWERIIKIPELTMKELIMELIIMKYKLIIDKYRRHCDMLVFDKISFFWFWLQWWLQYFSTFFEIDISNTSFRGKLQYRKHEY